ncbi:hypothetical protein [Labrys neptuniae]
MHTWMAFTRSIAVISLGLASVANAAENKRADVLAADLAFLSVCSERDEALISRKVEEFLRQEGFRVLDIARLAREQKIFYPYAFNIVSHDERRRSVSMVAFPIAPDDYHVTLSSPPPTVHDTDLESRLMAFLAKNLGCEVRQVSRNENAEAAGSMYRRVYEQAEGWFKEAEDMAPPKAK